jgi:hypothetical protein
VGVWVCGLLQLGSLLACLLHSCLLHSSFPLPPHRILPCATYLPALLQAEQCRADHAAPAIELLQTAHSLLKQQGAGRRGSGGGGATLRHVALLLAQEHLASGDAATAAALLSDVAGVWVCSGAVAVAEGRGKWRTWEGGRKLSMCGIARSIACCASDCGEPLQISPPSLPAPLPRPGPSLPEPKLLADVARLPPMQPSSAGSAGRLPSGRRLCCRWSACACLAERRTPCHRLSRRHRWGAQGGRKSALSWRGQRC